MKQAQTVNAYIAARPPQVRRMLAQLRRLIKTAVPQAEEKISYAMPYYGYRGRLTYFAAFRDHVSLFVMAGARKALAREIKPRLTGKATMRLPIGQPLPARLITRIVKIQAAANQAKSDSTHRNYK